MFEVAVSVRDIGLFILFAALLYVLIYLGFVLKRLSDLFRDIHAMVKVNEKAVNDLLQTAPQVVDDAAFITAKLRGSAEITGQAVPEIIRNVEEISGSVSHSVKSLDRSISSVGSGITDTVSRVRGSSKAYLDYLDPVLEVLKLIFLVFSGDKKRKKRS